MSDNNKYCPRCGEHTDTGFRCPNGCDCSELSGMPCSADNFKRGKSGWILGDKSTVTDYDFKTRSYSFWDRLKFLFTGVMK